MPKAVAILEVMWDWEAKTSSAGYAETAPPYFSINPHNFTGRRLYSWLGHSDLLVTNACPELVSSARGRGTPDPGWLQDNLLDLEPFELLLVCGRVAQATYDRAWAKKVRTIEVPHPAARCWTRKGLDFTTRIIREGTLSLSLNYVSGRLVATPL